MIVYSLGKTKVKIYGGFNTIGGNCVVVESPSMSIMLDQGVNFTQLKNFYGFSIQPDSVEELREMKVIPPKEAYEGIEEIYISHLHLDHLGSLNIPEEVSVYVPSKEIAEILSRSWWFSWKQHLFPQTLSFADFKDVERSKRIRYVKVSHSAFPSFAFRIDTEDVSIIYTGDFRLTTPHTILSNTTENLKELAEDHVDLAIIEGTNFSRKMNFLTPSQFKAMLRDILERYDRTLLFITAHPLDLEATLAILELLWKSDYTPVFENSYYAQLLDVMIDIIRYPVENELIFAPRSTSGIGFLNNFELEYLSMLRDRKIAIFIPATGIKDVKTIVKLLDEDTSGLLHISILGEPLSEEWIIEEKKISNWLRFLGITSYRFHLSGHYHPYEFKDIIEAINPKEIIPVHTLIPDTMLNLFKKYLI